MARWLNDTFTAPVGRIVSRFIMRFNDIITYSDKNSDECHICFDKIGYYNIAVPDCCNHKFCYRCLKTWSSRVNTCPVDRKMFREFYFEDFFTNKMKTLTVRNKARQHCQICRQSNDDETVQCERCFNTLHENCRGTGRVCERIRKWLCSECDVPPAGPSDDTHIEQATERESRRIGTRSEVSAEQATTHMPVVISRVIGRNPSVEEESSPENNRRRQITPRTENRTSRHATRSRSRSPIRRLNWDDHRHFGSEGQNLLPEPTLSHTDIQNNVRISVGSRSNSSTPTNSANISTRDNT